MFGILHQRNQQHKQSGFANLRALLPTTTTTSSSAFASPLTTSPALVTVAKYFVTRLLQFGVNDIWGLSGDYIGGILDAAIAGGITVHTPATEQEGGYAANGYAMSSKKPGVIITTYGVGTFNTVNAISTGWVGMTPMVVINGSPSKTQFQSNRHQGILYHHMMESGRYSERDVFQPVTAEAFIITEPGMAGAQIDAALLACLTYKLPVYLEFETSVYEAEIPGPVGHLPILATESVNDQVDAAVQFVLRHFVPEKPGPLPYNTNISTTTEDSVEQVMSFLQNVKSKKPLIWQGAEINRYNAEEEFKEFIKVSGIPYVSSVDGKGVISEFNEYFQGVYCGNFTTDKRVVQTVNDSDFFISLGVWYTDVALGGTNLAGTSPAGTGGPPAPKTPKLFVDANRLSVQTSNREIANVVNIKSFLKKLTEKWKEGKYKVDNWVNKNYEEHVEYSWLKPTTALTYDVFFNWFKSYLQEQDKATKLKRENVICIADATLAIFPAMTIKVHENCAYSEVVWGSIGWSSGSSVGIATANPDKRVFVFVGDGGLQNCSTGPSTAALDKLNPIYYVFQNNTYAIDQYLIDKTSIPANNFKPYNNIPAWDYAKLAEAFNCEGRNARTVEEVQNYTNEALNCTTKKPFIIAVHIPRTDVPSGLATTKQ